MMRYFQECVWYIISMCLFLCTLFAFFENTNLRVLDLNPKDLQISKTINIFNKPYKIQNNSNFVNTSLNSEIGIDILKNNTEFHLDITHKISDFLKEQNSRQRHIQSACKTLETSGSNPILWRSSINHLFADRQHHLTFCPVYKSASTSWLTNLLQLNGISRDGDLTPIQIILHRTFQKINEFEYPALSKSSVLFIIVRHPFERLVSCYHDKFEVANKGEYYGRYGENMIKSYRIIPEHHRNNKNTLLKTVKAFINSKDFKTHKELPNSLKGNPYASPIGPTFAEFTRFVLESTPEDEHWKPMYKYCSLCSIDYDIILKFENLHAESQSFIDHLNYTSILKPRWENPSEGGNRSGDRTCDYFKQLSINTVKRLIGKYKNDLLLFQYLPDKYLQCA